MSAMAAAPPPRLDSVLSFNAALPDADPAAAEEVVDTTPAFVSEAGSDADDDESFEFEFAFAPPLASQADFSPADDLFARGRIIPAYPLFDRHLLLPDNDEPTASSSSTTAPPSPDTYCAWAPRSAPGSPTREFPKSASTGDARRSWRLRDLVARGGGRSHSDGKEKFLFLQPTTTPSKQTAAAKASAPAKQKQQSKTTKKGGKASAAGGVSEMDLATAHKLFYGKQGGGGALAGDRQKQSYLPYRPGIVGFFTAARALGRSHHPY